jgi:hypothetical protein
MHGEKKTAHRVSVGNPEEKIPQEGPRHWWQSIIKMDLTGILWGGMDWVNMALSRDQEWALVNMLMNLHVQQNAAKFLHS